ncbi:hypothetical protein IMZ11_20570 [Microtetraspora sp. AC03309]|uniref:hypothetical protein n=1 Tax=Microtetraspora sp. AC03309 TaxID=2779376 RepID=UPI001E54B14F|nr:hypothetical protein [Microtetraspora sp. AC03309]MCC5578025.1 hypothetical protein [Microtetraspora sp. AC03309]
MRTRRETGRSAVAAVLPKLVLLASVLLGVGLSYATAHFCGMPMSGASLSHSSMHGVPAASSADITAAHGIPAASSSAAFSSMEGMTARGTSTMPPTTSFTTSSIASSIASSGLSVTTRPNVAAVHEGASGANPFVQCLTAVAAVLVTVALGLIVLGRPSGDAADVRERPARLPAVRGSPSPFALSLQRVTVLRV